MRSQIFTDNGTDWRLVPELPEQPKDWSGNVNYDFIEYDYEKKLAEAKANALPVVNPDEIWKVIKRPGIIGHYYTWPGTWEQLVFGPESDPVKIVAKLIAPNASEGADATQQQQLQRGKFYWIKIQHWDMNNRLPDKWSIAQWDANSFEELNEMYRVEDVIEIGPMIPTPEEITRWYNTQPKQL